jgi:hypothetical protein
MNYKIKNIIPLATNRRETHASAICYVTLRPRSRNLSSEDGIVQPHTDVVKAAP